MRSTLPRRRGWAPARFLAVASAALLFLPGCGSESSGPDPDTAAPTVQIQAPAANFVTAGGTVQVSGTAADDRGVTRVAYTLNGAPETAVTVTPGTTVTFAFTATLAAGANTLVVNAYDAAGNRTGATVGGTQDGQAPAIQLTAPAADGPTIVPTASLQGTVSDNSGVTRLAYQLNGGAEVQVPITAGANVTFDVAVPLALGANAVTLNAYDAAGNRAQATRTIDRRAAGEVLLTVLDGTGAPVADAQIVAALQPGASGPQPAFVYSGSGLFGVEYVSAGTYRVAIPVGLTFTLQVTRGGTLPATYHAVSVSTTAPTHLETVQLVPAAAATGSALVDVVDAFDGQALSGVALTVRSGLNAGQGTAVASATTGAAGTATFASLAAGYYTVQMTRAGYAPGYFTMTIRGGQGTYRGSIAPTVSTSQVRIILDWGATPSDLDSHLTGPAETGTGRFHVAYFDMEYRGAAGDLIAALDHDDTSSYGPETVTLYQRRSGRYRYSVHDYSNQDTPTSTALSLSSARVRVYAGSTLVQTFFVPRGPAGTLWTVFEIDGTTIIPVNTITHHEDAGTVPDRTGSRRKKP